MSLLLAWEWWGLQTYMNCLQRLFITKMYPIVMLCTLWNSTLPCASGYCFTVVSLCLFRRWVGFTMHHSTRITPQSSWIGRTATSYWTGLMVGWLAVTTGDIVQMAPGSELQAQQGAACTTAAQGPRFDSRSGKPPKLWSVQFATN